MRQILYTVHVFRRAAVLAGSILLCLPLLAHAEQATEWDFSQGSVPGKWNVREFTEATITPVGLKLVTTDRAALLWRETGLTHPVDVVTLVVSARKGGEANLLWHEEKYEAGVLTKLPFFVETTAAMQSIDIIPGNIRNWVPDTNALGFEFGPQADVIIHKVILRHWSVGEKFAEAWRSFWTFDKFRPYSINFLWGPLLSLSPPARAQLFEHLPPRAISAVRVFYAAIILAAVIAGAWMLKARGSAHAKRGALRLVAGTVIALWLLFDLRMGAELLSYAATDLRTNVLASHEKKQFREYGRFYAILDQALPALTAVPRYGLLTDANTPYYQNLRYYSYPSLPVAPDANAGPLSLLFVVDRPDLRSEGGRVVMQDGTEIARDGKLLLDFGSGSFLFSGQ